MILRRKIMMVRGCFWIAWEIGFFKKELSYSGKENLVSCTDCSFNAIRCIVNANVNIKTLSYSDAFVSIFRKVQKLDRQIYANIFLYFLFKCIFFAFLTDNYHSSDPVHQYIDVRYLTYVHEQK